MSFDPVKLRVPLGVQVGVVAVLFVAALVALWTTGASVVARERRRSEAKGLLDPAGNELAARGREIIARAGEFPDFPEEPSRDELDRELSAKAAAVARAIRGHRGGLPRPAGSRASSAPPLPRRKPPETDAEKPARRSRSRRTVGASRACRRSRPT